jgi:hypothetical protein
VKIFLVTVETSVAGATTYAFSTYEKAVAYVDEQAVRLAYDPNDIWMRVPPKVETPKYYEDLGDETYRYHVRFGGNDQAYVIVRELDAAP